MMAGLLTVASTLMCPHGATVSGVPSGNNPTAGGSPILLATDTFTIAGCPFTLPGTPPIPCPCILVQWIVTNTMSTANAMPTLGASSTGLCIGALGAPQGTVVVAATQPQVTGS